MCVGLVIQIAETNLTDMNGAGFVGGGVYFNLISYLELFCSSPGLRYGWVYLSCGNLVLKRVVLVMW